MSHTNIAGKISFHLVKFILLLTRVFPLKMSYSLCTFIVFIGSELRLKRRKIALIQNDQSHPDGIYIKFFNKYVPSPGGPALLAKRVGVPIIPAYVCRNKYNHHEITILPEIPLQNEDNHEKFMKENTQIMIDWIAEILIKHPTEWLWLHNRWKRAKTSDAHIKT